MAIHSVLSSAKIRRLTAPGSPSLIAVALPAVLFVRFTTVRRPANNPSDCSCCPTTYIVDESMSALLEPPGIGILVKLPEVGKLPEACPVAKIIGFTGKSAIEAFEPPHSGPQFRT